MKALQQMTPEEVTAEIVVRIGELQALGLVPVLKSEFRTPEQQEKIARESRVHTVKKSHHFLSKVKKHV